MYTFLTEAPQADKALQHYAKAMLSPNKMEGDVSKALGGFATTVD